MYQGIAIALEFEVVPSLTECMYVRPVTEGAKEALNSNEEFKIRIPTCH